MLLLDPAKKPTDITLASDLALYLAKSGNRAEAETELDNIAELESQPPDILYKAAVTRELLGQRQNAVELLGLAIAGGYSRAEVEHDPELTGLRADVMYHKLMLGLDGG